MEGLVLFPAIVVSLSAGAYWLVRRRRRRAATVRVVPPVATPAPPAAASAPSMRPLLCPTCNGQYPPGLRFCPLDARALVQNSEWSMGTSTVVEVSCKACHRSFEPSTRFCPYDAQELVPLPPSAPAPPGMPAVTGAARTPPVEAALRAGGRRSGKICPRCTERYAGGESFCGRDGSELVTLN